MEIGAFIIYFIIIFGIGFAVEKLGQDEVVGWAYLISSAVALLEVFFEILSNGISYFGFWYYSVLILFLFVIIKKPEYSLYAWYSLVLFFFFIGFIYL